jgi:hypothetical protein
VSGKMLLVLASTVVLVVYTCVVIVEFWVPFLIYTDDKERPLVIDTDGIQTLWHQPLFVS